MGLGEARFLDGTAGVAHSSLRMSPEVWLTSSRVCDRLSLTWCGAKGSDVNHPLCLIRRIGLVCTMGMMAVSWLLPARPAPVQAAVHLLYFRATGEEDRVVLQWATAQELNNVGFNLYRTETPDFNDSSKVDLGFIPAQHLGQIEGADYSYIDSDIQAGTTYTYYYWLEDVDFQGVRTRHGPVPASTPTETPTSTPTATAASTPTRVPTATPTLAPTATPSSTSTTLPTSTPTTLPTATSPRTSTPETGPTSMVRQPPSPTTTAEGSSLAIATPSAVPGQVTPTPTATSMTGSSDTSPGSTGAAGGDSQAGTSGWSSLRLRWPTLDPSTILLFISLVAAFGVLLLSVALALVRKLSL